MTRDPLTPPADAPSPDADRTSEDCARAPARVARSAHCHAHPLHAPAHACRALAKCPTARLVPRAAGPGAGLSPACRRPHPRRVRQHHRLDVPVRRHRARPSRLAGAVARHSCVRRQPPGVRPEPPRPPGRWVSRGGATRMSCPACPRRGAKRRPPARSPHCSHATPPTAHRLRPAQLRPRRTPPPRPSPLPPRCRHPGVRRSRASPPVRRPGRPSLGALHTATPDTRGRTTASPAILIRAD